MNRPTAVTIFGIVNIAFAAIGLLSLVVVLTIFPPTPGDFDPAGDAGLLRGWTMITQGLGFVANLVLLASGVGLLQMRPWGRRLAIYYAIYAVVVTVISTAISFSMIESQMQGMGGPGGDERFVMGLAIVGGVIGVAISLLHPGLLWYFMTRPKIAAAFGEAPISAPHDLPGTARRLTPDNPYASPTTPVGDQSLVAESTGEQVLESVVPINNGPALLAYYTGLFSIFPVFGLPLAVVAIVSGRKALRNVKSNPEIKGKTHARVGLICGWGFGLFNLLLTGLIIAGLIAAVTSS